MGKKINVETKFDFQLSPFEIALMGAFLAVVRKIKGDDEEDGDGDGDDDDDITYPEES